MTLPLAVRGLWRDRGVAVRRNQALMNWKHAANNHRLFQHFFITPQVELGLEFAAPLSIGGCEEVTTHTQNEQKTSFGAQSG